MAKLRKTKQSKKKSRTRVRRTKRINTKHLAKLRGGGCGCGSSVGVSSGGSGISQTPNIIPTMNGGGAGAEFAPSFSGLHESKFYPLNNYQNDPTMMAAGSRQMSGVEIGMNKTTGGGRKKSKMRNKKLRTTKKMRGGIGLGGLLSGASGVLLGNGMPDNVVANQGGLSGVVSTYQVLSGNHNPTTSVNEPVSRLYNEYNKAMV